MWGVQVRTGGVGVQVHAYLTRMVPMLITNKALMTGGVGCAGCRTMTRM